MKTPSAEAAEILQDWSPYPCATGRGRPDGPAPDRAPRETRCLSDSYLALLLFVAMLCLAIVAVFHHKIDSDEPQHLHVVWAWTQGLLQYRDVFDNHMPLFHMLNAPLLAAIGERPDALLLMRLAMLPLYGLTLWGVFILGSALFSRQVGLWASLLTGFFPSFFQKALEFRTDDLWVTLWLLALATLMGGKLTRARAFLGGALLGAALCVSMKTILLGAALACAALMALTLAFRNDVKLSGRALARNTMAIIIGIVIPPLATTLFFIAHNAFGAFLYGIVYHNLLPGLGRWHNHALRGWLLFPTTLLGLGWGASALFRNAPDTAVGMRRVIVILAGGVYVAALVSFWPLLTRQDYLPFYPLLALWLTPLLLALPSRLGSHALGLARARLLGPGLAVVLEIVVLAAGERLWRDDTRAELAIMTEALRLTGPGDLILDLKGETVFRQRPFYYALEGITKKRIEYGLIADDIPERLVATRTCVALGDGTQWPHRAREFLDAHYIPVGRLRVAGAWLGKDERETTPRALLFDVAIPTRYVIVIPRGAAAGWLDGKPYDGARFLGAGEHRYQPASGEDQLALVWAQAVERGFSPYPLAIPRPLLPTSTLG